MPSDKEFLKARRMWALNFKRLELIRKSCTMVEWNRQDKRLMSYPQFTVQRARDFYKNLDIAIRAERKGKGE